MVDMLTVYSYENCGTCKKALKWLAAHEIEIKVVPIVDQPPSPKVLSTILKETELPVRKLFNTSGQLYRSGGYKEKLSQMSDKEAIAELASHGKLIKRPIIVGDGVYLVGFKEADYEHALL